MTSEIENVLTFSKQDSLTGQGEDNRFNCKLFNASVLILPMVESRLEMLEKA